MSCSDMGDLLITPIFPPACVICCFVTHTAAGLASCDFLLWVDKLLSLYMLN